MKKTLILTLLMISTIYGGVLFAQEVIPQNTHIHNHSDGKILWYGYANDKDHGPWNMIEFQLLKSDGTTLAFAIPADSGNDAELNRMMSLIAGAYHTQSNVRVYHNNKWSRPHDGLLYNLADRIYVGTFQ